VSENRLGFVYQQLRQRFAASDMGKTGLEAFLLLEWAVGASYKDIVADPDRLLDEAHLAKIEEGVRRRLGGESIHRIRGYREFYGLNFQLSPDTLEPRPDSEALIDLVLPVLRERASQGGKVQLLDMGTGSGALAIALLCQVPSLYATGVDIAQGALDAAVINAHLNRVEARFQPLKSNWFDKVAGKYDMIIANPPYIVRADIARLDRMVRDFDPIIALDGGEDGLDSYRQLALMSGHFLLPDGFVGVEIGQGQQSRVTELFVAQGLSLIENRQDLAGICRALLFRRG